MVSDDTRTLFATHQSCTCRDTVINVKPIFRLSLTECSNIIRSNSRGIVGKGRVLHSTEAFPQGDSSWTTADMAAGANLVTDDALWFGRLCALSGRKFCTATDAPFWLLLEISPRQKFCCCRIHCSCTSIMMVHGESSGFTYLQLEDLGLS